MILLKLVPLSAAAWVTLACAVQPVGTGETPDRTTPTAAESTNLRRADREAVSISIGGDTREVQVVTPTGLDSGDGARLLPLLVLLHPNNGSPSGMISLAEADLLSEREGVIVALPPAQGRSWRARQLGAADASDGRDAAYVSEIIGRLVADYPVDPNRVAVAGFSMGAVLAGRIACERADLVAAAVLVGGTDWGGECAPTQAVSVLLVHGTSDRTFTIADAEAFADKWRELDGCPAPAAESTPAASAVARTSTGCDDGTAVEFVRVERQGHSWFKNPNATEIMWSFLTTHQQRR